jgi:ribosomal protein L40E
MTVYCHRCSATLDAEASFCPHCAAPQLRVAALESADGNGAAGPGPIHGGMGTTHDRRTVEWQNVIRLALALAIPVGLCSLVFPLSVVAPISAPIILISLYRRRRPGSLLDGRSGFRIGTLTGLLAAYVSAFGIACWQIFQRYSLHQGPWMDQQYSMVIRQSIEASGRMTHNDPSSVQQTRMMLDFALAPNGRATYALFSMVALASGIVLLAGLGGVLGARLTRRSTQQIGQQ